MPNTKSAKKRLRQSKKRRLYNRYYKIGAKKEMKAFFKLKDAEEAKQRVPKLYSIIDKLVRRGIIHRNKAARYKRRVALYAQKLAAAQAAKSN